MSEFEKWVDGAGCNIVDPDNYYAAEKAFEAGQRNGLERAAEIAEDISEPQPYNQYVAKYIAEAIRKEITND